MTRPPAPAALAAVVLVLLVAACGRSARDDGGEPAALPATSPVAADLGASVGDEPTVGRLADIVSARIDHRAGTLTVRVRLARLLDGDALTGDDQIAVGAYLLSGPDDLDPYAAFLLLDPGRPARFLYGPWLAEGRPIQGSLEGTELTLVVEGLPQGRFRYAQFFAEDRTGSEVLPEGGTSMVAINAADLADG